VPLVTLEEAVGRALAVNPAVVRGSGTVNAARAAERSAVGGFLPRLNLGTDATLSSSQRFNAATSSPVQGTTTSYAAGLSASMDLYTGGRQSAELRSARAETDAAEASLVAERFAVILATKQAFYEALRATELVGVAEARVQRAEEGLTAAARQLGVGAATLSDRLRARFELTDARMSLLEAESGRRTAALALGRVVGVDGPVRAAPPASLEPRPLALTDADLVERAVRDAPPVREAEARLHSGEANVRASRAQYFPTLSLSGGYDWFNQDLALDGGRTSWRGVLALSYPLFDGFQRDAAVARAAADAQGARADLPDARRSARSDAERLLEALRIAERRIELARENARVAEEDLRVQRERYSVGASTSLDQLTSRANLAQAEADLVGARYDYQIARAELEALVGMEL
jgi:outer membrane protein TolC